MLLLLNLLLRAIQKTSVYHIPYFIHKCKFRLSLSPPDNLFLDCSFPKCLKIKLIVVTQLHSLDQDGSWAKQIIQVLHERLCHDKTLSTLIPELEQSHMSEGEYTDSWVKDDCLYTDTISSFPSEKARPVWRKWNKMPLEQVF